MVNVKWLETKPFQALDIHHPWHHPWRILATGAKSELSAMPCQNDRIWVVHRLGNVDQIY